jgi:hypothetical protein
MEDIPRLKVDWQTVIQGFRTSDNLILCAIGWLPGQISLDDHSLPTHSASGLRDSRSARDRKDDRESRDILGFYSTFIMRIRWIQARSKWL